jgi:hypothetical protein
MAFASDRDLRGAGADVVQRMADSIDLPHYDLASSD